MRNDILERLQIDPGKRTLGELLQDREAALCEIARLRSETERQRGGHPATTPQRAMRPRPGTSEADAKQPAFRAGTLIRISDVCELIGMSRATVYKLLREGRFPEPVRPSMRAVRWRVDEVEAWRDGLQR